MQNAEQTKEDVVEQQAQVEVGQENSEPTYENLQTEVADLKDKNLRLLAEMQNLRTRQQKDLKDAREYAITGFANDMLVVLENLNRANESIPASEDEAFKSFVEGLNMVRDEVNRILGKYGIERVAPNIGDDFDYKVHQAVVQVPTNEVAEGKIVQLIQAGYTLKDRPLRPAIVAVAKAVAENKEEKVDTNA
ncbi:MAG TPA: nucleotide exchange factor GrpE [Alphaproteobacteria bacterium]|nr:nucleotide exchange factor GrpE [Alphaproteobacteria bacterium]